MAGRGSGSPVRWRGRARLEAFATGVPGCAVRATPCPPCVLPRTPGLPRPLGCRNATDGRVSVCEVLFGVIFGKCPEVRVLGHTVAVLSLLRRLHAAFCRGRSRASHSGQRPLPPPSHGHPGFRPRLPRGRVAVAFHLLVGPSVETCQERCLVFSPVKIWFLVESRYLRSLYILGLTCHQVGDAHVP